MTLPSDESPIRAEHVAVFALNAAAELRFDTRDAAFLSPLGTSTELPKAAEALRELTKPLVCRTLVAGQHVTYSCQPACGSDLQLAEQITELHLSLVNRYFNKQDEIVLASSSGLYLQVSLSELRAFFGDYLLLNVSFAVRKQSTNRGFELLILDDHVVSDTSIDSEDDATY